MGSKFREPDIRANELRVLNQLTVNSGASMNVDGPETTKFEIAPVPITADSYRYGLRVDSDVFFLAGAALKHYMVQLSGDRESGNAVTGDSNDAMLKISHSNYAANDANFIDRGINIGVTNRSGGTLGRMENSFGVQSKGGATTPIIIAGTFIAENYGTNATECFAIDAIIRDEVGAGALRAGIRVRNDDRSGVSALDAMILLDSHASSGGADMLIDGSAVELTEYESGTEVVILSFQGANGTTYLLVHDSDAPTAVEVKTTVS